MKKLIALISSLAVVATMSLTSFAAVEEAVTDGVTVADGVFTATLANDNTQTTIVAVEGETISTSSIQYINQEADADSFSFQLKDDYSATETDKTINVYMGGDAIDKTLVGSITYTVVADTFTITFKNADGTVLKEYTVDEGAMPAYDGETPVKAEDDENTYEFDAWDPAVVAATADAEYTATFTATPKAPAGIVGDVNGDSVVDALDISAVIDQVLGSADVTASGDINVDATVDALDISAVISLILGA